LKRTARQGKESKSIRGNFISKSLRNFIKLRVKKNKKGRKRWKGKLLRKTLKNLETGYCDRMTEKNHKKHPRGGSGGILTSKGEDLEEKGAHGEKI